MQLHQIQVKNKDRKRIGRGGKRGTYSGKGLKGQKSRSGHNFQPVIRELIKSYPKLRGYKFKSYKEIAEINVSILDKVFKDSDVITPEVLVEKNVIRQISGKTPTVKVLGSGEISKKIILKNFLISESAKTKIEKAGGTVEEIKKKEVNKTEKKIVKAEKKVIKTEKKITKIAKIVKKDKPTSKK